MLLAGLYHQAIYAYLEKPIIGNHHTCANPFYRSVDVGAPLATILDRRHELSMGHPPLMSGSALSPILQSFFGNIF